MEPKELVESAIMAGLDGVVITEHHYQWTDKEIEELKQKVSTNGLIILPGAEITTDAGDILVYGLPNSTISGWERGISAEEVVSEVEKRSAFCISAHPTRRYHHFDHRLETLSIPAMEVMSVNMNMEEQEQAKTWAKKLSRVQVCASDAHQASCVGKYWIEVESENPNQKGFLLALKEKRFHMGSQFLKVWN